MRKVYVVINPELGWDNVVGIFDENLISEEELLEEYPYPDYVIKVQDVQVTVEDY